MQTPIQNSLLILQALQHASDLLPQHKKQINTLITSFISLKFSEDQLREAQGYFEQAQKTALKVMKTNGKLLSDKAKKLEKLVSDLQGIEKA